MKYNITQSRLLYVYSIDDRKHKGLLKVGEVFVDNEVAEQGSAALVQTVRAALSDRPYLEGVEYKIEYVECTTYDALACYKAEDIHKSLLLAGVEHVCLSKRDNADIWFTCDVERVKRAIAEVKNMPKTKDGTGPKMPFSSIVFRPEQRNAIEATVKKFGTKASEYLWNAKMRFGKTTCGLEVARRMGVGTTLIVTHRPVVDKGWHDDFDKIFGDVKDTYTYATRMKNDADSQGDFRQLIKKVERGEQKLIFFVSIQYLRLSTLVGGKNKDPLKREIMQYPWDLVMIDEAHEGTESAMGKRVLEQLRKPETKVLSLSGTPFNLLDKFQDKEDCIYTWDYVMEQAAKRDWERYHYGDPNPYAVLPRMQILTFTVSEMLHQKIGDGNSFILHEFFRTWTGETGKDGKPMPSPDMKGRFVYEEQVRSFVRLLFTPSETSQYPFSRPEFCEHFAHTFWLLPGVASAAAMEQMIDEIQRNNKEFHVVNVAGDGNMDDEDGNAYREVRNAIDNNDRTITLSCGKLTTGVNVPEWTAVLCMKGSENTPAANYMQTIFRSQTHAVLKGRQKSDCYVFDFAPDRALTAVAETAKMQVQAATGKKGKGTQEEEENHLKAFLELCPVLSMDGAQMGREFSANELFQKLNTVYIERAVRSGYSDTSIYNQQALLDLTADEEKVLDDVHGIVGASNTQWKVDTIDVNKQGFAGTKDDEDTQFVYYLTDLGKPSRPLSSKDMFYENGAAVPTDEDWTSEMPSVSKSVPLCYISHSSKHKGVWHDYTEPVLWREWKEPKASSDTTPEQEKRKQEYKEKQARISVLRVVSTRIPLLVYGARILDENGNDIPKAKIEVDTFADLIDNASWDEYMPKGFTKAHFKKLQKFFDRSVFTGAAQRIRTMVENADNKSIEDRIVEIGTIHKFFHNPDKETVLTPWEVVNRQLSDTLGGWTFHNDRFDDFNKEENKDKDIVFAPRYVDHGAVTDECFKDNAVRILEINSKTGLYPLYMAYSIFREIKEKKYRGIGLTGERGVYHNADEYNEQVNGDQAAWEDVLQDNIFVVCRTEMAASITRRTLAGFRKVRMNVKCYQQNVPVKALSDAGVIKKGDKGFKKDGREYTFNGKTEKKCDMVEVLRAAPEIFCRDIVQGNKFWKVYSSIPKKENEDINNMKFTAVVGNPPYQLTVAKTETDNGQKRSASIFQHFQLASEEIAKYTSLIYPGGRWIHRSGKGMEQFGLAQINDPHLAKLEFFPESSDIFEKVGIADGISIVLKDMSKESDGFAYVYTTGNVSFEIHADNPGEELMPLNPYDISIVNSINDVVFGRFNYMHDSVLSQKLFSIESDFVEKNPDKVREYRLGDSFDVDTEIKLFTNDKAGKAGRGKWYITNLSNITTGKEHLHRWKVVVSSANAGGQKRSNQLAILDNHSAFGRSRVALKTFATEREAKNFYKYVKSELIRFAFLMTDESLTSLAKQVPDLGNYADDNGVIDFNGDVNAQLYALFNINEANQQHIREVLATKAE